MVARSKRTTMGNTIKVHSLTGRITSQLILKAFKSVKRNRGAAGVDKVSIAMFEANLEQNLQALMRDLKQGSLQPRPLRRVYISKGPRSKKMRPLGIPIVRDRVAQEVLRRLLAPIFEPMFHRCSFGFIKNRNCHMAIEELLRLHNEGYKVVLDADVKAFFDQIPHKVIMSLVAEQVADGNILKLIHRFLTAGVMEDGAFKPTSVGTPQGGVISPLLANIVLDQLDWVLDKAGYRFVRYADDFVVVTRSHQQAQEALTVVSHVIESDLGLQLSAEKTHVSTWGKGYEFLGFFLSSRSIRMRDKSLQKFKDKVRELTVRKHNLDGKVVVKLNRVIRGTANYFAPHFASNRWLFQKLDSWVRMRLRCMKFKRKTRRDNYKLRCKIFARKLGLLTLESFCTYRDTRGKVRHAIPRHGATPSGVAR